MQISALGVLGLRLPRFLMRIQSIDSEIIFVCTILDNRIYQFWTWYGLNVSMFDQTQHSTQSLPVDYGIRVATHDYSTFTKTSFPLKVMKVRKPQE